MESPQSEKSRILASNLILFKALEELLAPPGEAPVLLLKGAALISRGLRRFADRGMEDIDLLVRPGHFEAAVRRLEAAGYRKRREAPGEFSKDGVVFDLHEEIWYLDEEEIEGLWERSRLVSLAGGQAARVPAAQDLLIHVLAHAAVHHGAVTARWGDDVRSILEGCAGEFDLDEARRELERLGLGVPAAWYAARAGIDLGRRAPPGAAAWPLERWRFAGRGHLLRLWYARDWRFRLRLWRKALFPAPEFLARRYDSPGGARLLALRALRPLLLAGKLVGALLPRHRRGIDNGDAGA